ncbi:MULTISPECIES: hypothetical protein [Neptunomonas]|uniref:Uncharacterized protein n=1 Tax=Neptunomonas phycophila TaxID=1572645 RepID=A0AAW7XDW3_9GAMM|nr:MULTISPECIES: hypothetical protein [Neptunomonas]MDN2659782.1 hypothetical protein [Neptunomonas sp. CHC150]MDO6452305.1 hypothetical protein [Neptunomonas phycophila]MDO6469483.1 hypothetical protein [Neptunomonas phycophila]
MKYVVFILVFIGSIFATYKITFSMTQEIMGALNIRTHIANHKVMLKLSEVTKEGDIEKIEEFVENLEQFEIGTIEQLTELLESGSYTFATQDEINVGKEYLEQLEK